MNHLKELDHELTAMLADQLDEIFCFVEFSSFFGSDGEAHRRLDQLLKRGAVVRVVEVMPPARLLREHGDWDRIAKLCRNAEFKRAAAEESRFAVAPEWCY